MSETTPGAEPTPEPTPQPASSASTRSTDAVETLKQADRLDLATIGAGVLAFLASLMPYYTVSVDVLGSGASSSVNAWHGFFGWFGAVLALAGAAVLAAKILGVSLPFPVRTTVVGLFAAGAVCTLLALFVVPGGSCEDVVLMGDVCDMIDQGHGFGYWLALVSTLGGSALAAMRRLAA